MDECGCRKVSQIMDQPKNAEEKEFGRASSLTVDNSHCKVVVDGVDQAQASI